jgi:hypothetical protein
MEVNDFWEIIIFTHNEFRELLEIIIKIMSSLKFYWVLNHKFSCFPFWIFTFTTINV